MFESGFWDVCEFHVCVYTRTLCFHVFVDPI